MAKSNVSFQGALRGLNEARVIASGADKDGSIREGFGPGLLAASMFSVAFCHPGLDELKTLGGIPVAATCLAVRMDGQNGVVPTPAVSLS